MLNKSSYWLATATLTLSLAGQAVAADKITVFAAASLTNALQEIATRYQQQSGTDLFISADQQWMDDAAAKQSIEAETRVTLLGNDLVLIAPKAAGAAPVTISAATNWKNLLQGQRLAVGDPAHVPAGIYAKAALQKLGAWQQLASQLAPASNVRAALALVERNETPYGIVYGSDAVASKGVMVAGRFPADSHPPVEYPMAIVNAHQNAAVTAFWHYLQGPEAAAIFKQYGFTPKR